MQNKFLAISTALIFAACSSGPTPKASTNDSMTSNEGKKERYKQIVKSSTEAFIASDVNGSAKGFASNVIDYGEGTRPPVKSLDSFKYNLSQFFQTVSNLKGENLRYMADQDWVMVWGDWSWTWKSDPANPKSKSKPFRMRGADIFKFNPKGEIAEHYGIIQPMQESNHSYMTPNQ